jgi:hypothetical protein
MLGALGALGRPVAWVYERPKLLHVETNACSRKFHQPVDVTRTHLGKGKASKAPGSCTDVSLRAQLDTRCDEYFLVRHSEDEEAVQCPSTCKCGLDVVREPNDRTDTLQALIGALLNASS